MGSFGNVAMSIKLEAFSTVENWVSGELQNRKSVRKPKPKSEQKAGVKE